MDIWKMNFGSGTAWQMGDANYDGVINGLDLRSMAAELGQAGPQRRRGGSGAADSGAWNPGDVGCRTDRVGCLRVEKAKVMGAYAHALSSRVVVFWRDYHSSQATVFSASGVSEILFRFIVFFCQNVIMKFADHRC